MSTKGVTGGLQAEIARSQVSESARAWGLPFDGAAQTAAHHFRRLVFSRTTPRQAIAIEQSSANDRTIGIEYPQQQALAHVRSQALGKALSDVFLDGVVEDVFNLDQIPRDRVDRSEAVGESH